MVTILSYLSVLVFSFFLTLVLFFGLVKIKLI